MRKTSHDGGDSTSITSGLDYDNKKIGIGLIKTTRNSLKKRVQSFSHESDETVVEPLLQKDKTENSTQCAKILSCIAKIEEVKKNEEDDANFDIQSKKPLKNNLSQLNSSVPTGETNGVTDIPKHNISTSNQIYNYMNTSVFANYSESVANTVKSHILIEMDGHKPAGHSTSPLIFTTAKIHTDSTNKEMELVQVTPVPILSTTISRNILSEKTVPCSFSEVPEDNKIKDIHNSKVLPPSFSNKTEKQKIDFNRSSDKFITEPPKQNTTTSSTDKISDLKSVNLPASCNLSNFETSTKDCIVFTTNDNIGGNSVNGAKQSRQVDEDMKCFDSLNLGLTKSLTSNKSETKVKDLKCKTITLENMIADKTLKGQNNDIQTGGRETSTNLIFNKNRMEKSDFETHKNLPNFGRQSTITDNLKEELKVDTCKKSESKQDNVVKDDVKSMVKIITKKTESKTPNTTIPKATNSNIKQTTDITSINKVDTVSKNINDKEKKLNTQKTNISLKTNASKVSTGKELSNSTITTSLTAASSSKTSQKSSSSNLVSINKTVSSTSSSTSQVSAQPKTSETKRKTFVSTTISKA